MESKEIKKAFEQMKKDIKKELGIEHGFTMSQRQIANRTATYLITSHYCSYEEDIERAKRNSDRVQAYPTWTAEEKERERKRTAETVEMYKELIRKFGTPLGKAQAEAEQIKNSKAFARFQEAVGKTECHIEDMDDCYYLRFTY